jgi:hypothetical protein
MCCAAFTAYARRIQARASSRPLVARQTYFTYEFYNVIGLQRGIKASGGCFLMINNAGRLRVSSYYLSNWKTSMPSSLVIDGSPRPPETPLKALFRNASERLMQSNLRRMGYISIRLSACVIAVVSYCSASATTLAGNKCELRGQQMVSACYAAAQSDDPGRTESQENSCNSQYGVMLNQCARDQKAAKQHGDSFRQRIRARN